MREHSAWAQFSYSRMSVASIIQSDTFQQAPATSQVNGSNSVLAVGFFDHNPLVVLIRMQKSNRCLMLRSLLFQDFNSGLL